MFFGKGETLNNGRYEIEAPLGGGGFGITYRARQTNTQQQVAIKTLNLNQAKVRSNFQSLQEKFINEAVALAQCHHPNVVKVYPQGFFQGELWCIVMEYIEGQTLGDYVEEKVAISESEAIALAKKLGDALKTVHEQRLLHRDIKPDNILLRNGDLKSPVLIDFGLARAYNEERLHSFSTMSGTLGFAPIEQLEGRQEEYGPWTDIYGLAAILYYVVTKQSPMASQYRKLVPEQSVAPKQYKPSLSDHFNQAILSGIALEPKDRPQSVEEWLADLAIKIVSPKTPPEKLAPTVSEPASTQPPSQKLRSSVSPEPRLLKKWAQGKTPVSLMSRRRLIQLVSWGGIGLGGVIVGKWLFDHWTTDNTQDSPVDENSKPLSEQALSSRAREITVKVIEGDSWGSGILIQREGDLYTVLTNAHVIFSQADPTNYKIETPDGKVYVATVREDLTFPQKEDLALLNFRSPQSQYQIAVFGDSSQLQPEDSIIATGFPFPTNQTEEPGWKLTQGEVWMLLDRALQEGYQLGYTGQIERGMSGGPILNLKGEVIGINGIDAYPLWERPYIYLEGGEPNLALQKKMDRYNWGIPAHTITQLLPELVVVSSAD